MSKQVTTLDEIRAQTEPQIVEIPGFREGTVIYVKLRIIDLTPKLLELKIGNPLLAEAQRMAKGGADKAAIAEQLDSRAALKDMLPLLDETAKESLVEPTYTEIAEIQPLTLPQKMRIFEYATGVSDLLPFRGEQGL